MTKYCNMSDYGYNGFTDTKTVLDSEDDVAHVKWGDSWRMPTESECQELFDNCKWEWVTQNNVNGYKVSSKSNGNSIFLPAAGYRNGTDLSDADSYGVYWSSSLITDYPLSACYLFFYSGGRGMLENYRYYGYSVRPVLPSSVAVSITLDKTEVTVDKGDCVTLTATILPSSLTNKTVAWTSSDKTVATVNQDGVVTCISSGTVTITASTTDGSDLKAECTVTVIDYNGHEYVDLGLPSKIKWATMNVGATTPEGYGDYYAWGETKTKSNYVWSTYEWCNGSHKTMTKYCNDSSYGNNGFTDTKTVLDPEDDVAHVKWGGDWRMPTQAECQELRDNCKWDWVTQNNIKGYKVTSKINGNSIFLPAAGYRYNTNLNYAGSEGDYWSSSLYADNTLSAWYLYFRSGNRGTSSYYRVNGYPVRPVSP